MSRPSDYHKLSAEEKRQYAVDQMREPPVVCRYCEAQTTAEGLLDHLEQRCPGRRPVHHRSRWITWRQAIAVGVSPKSLSRWVKAGRVRFTGPRSGRRYLLRDVVTVRAEKKRPPKLRRSLASETPAPAGSTEDRGGPLRSREIPDHVTETMEAPHNAQRYLSPEEISNRIGVKKKTLASWRTQGTGPPYLKLGGRVVYDWQDVEVWLAAQRRGGGQ